MQEHGGGVNTSTSPKVQYSYANGSAHWGRFPGVFAMRPRHWNVPDRAEPQPKPHCGTIRVTGMTYPNGRSVVDNYGTTDDINDASSRIQSMKDVGAGFDLVGYQYLGASGFVNAEYGQNNVYWTLTGSGNDPNTGDVYHGLDRFGRVVKCLWKHSSTTLAQIQYGYDRASNRTWRKDGVLTGYDELYSYDGLYRLSDQKRGTLNGTHTAITSATFQQQWGLDATGNWKTFKQENDGNGTWELNQTRTANKAKEITGISNSVGTAWTTPTYDQTGNMIGIPDVGTTATGAGVAWNPYTESQWNTVARTGNTENAGFANESRT